MFEKIKANILFNRLLRRPDINKAYAMVGPEDSWYNTIKTVHDSLAEIQKLPHENWEVTSDDGLKLKGIYYPCEGSEKTVVWVHGYTSHAERESAFPGLFYHSLGFNVLIPYLRAHGPSEGKYISFGPMESDDMERWVERVNEAHPTGSIVFHGLSMGGCVVLDLSTKDLKNVKCMVADAPNTNATGIFRTVAKSMFKKDHEKVFEAILLRYGREFGYDVEAFDCIRNITNCRYPMLLSAGSNENMDDILMRLKTGNPMETTILILPGCNHGNGMYKQTEMYQSGIRAFIEKNMTLE